MQHNVTTSSDGSFVIQIGSGSKFIGSYLNVNLNSDGLKVNVYIDPNSQNTYEQIVFCEDLEIKSAASDDKNSAWSNSYTNPDVGGDYRDIIIYPKKTRWYNNLVNLKSSGKAKDRNPFSSQDINNQKKMDS